MWELQGDRAPSLFGEFDVPVAQTQYEMSELLRQAGATLRGRNRADCPRCAKKRTISYATEVFTCHEGTCDFRGNVVTLAMELGLLKPLPPREAEQLRRTRERARQAAEEVSCRLREHRLVLQEEHRQLLDVLYGGQERLKRNHHPKIGQTLVGYARKHLRRVRAELAIIEDSPMPQRLEFLNANEGRQKGMVCAVIVAGGLEDASGRFTEVEWGNNCP